MPSKKYNKAEMWRSFLESDHLEVMSWAKENGITTGKERIRLTTPVEKLTKGWAEKKKGILERAIVKFEEDFQTKLEKNWKKTLKNASHAEMKIVNDFSLEISGGRIPEGTKALERVFKMFRLVLGKSTNNNQNTNANLNVSVSEEEEQAIADVINRNNAFYNRPGLETIEEHTGEGEGTEPSEEETL